MANPYTSKQVAQKVTKAKAELKKEQNKKAKQLGLDNGLILLVGKTSIKYQARILVSKMPKKFKYVLIGDYEDIKLDDAYKAVNIIRDKFLNDELEKQSTPLFKDYWQHYREITDKANHLSKQRILTKNSFYNTVLYVFADYRLNEITPVLVQELVKNLNTTQNHLHDCLSVMCACFTYALNEGVIEYNKLATLTKLPQFKANKADVKGFKFVTADRLKTVLFEPLEQYPIYYKVYVLLICLTACRKGEIQNLKWDNIDFNKSDNAPYGSILISNKDTKTRRDTNHDDYYIPLTKQLNNLLSKYREITKAIDSPLLFPSRTNKDKPLSSSSMLLPPNIANDMDLHGLRKTASTFLNANSLEHQFNKDDIEIVLHHKSDSNRVRAIYNKYDYRKEHYRLLSFYNDYIEREQLTQSFLELVK
nr:MAG TPA: Integrase [Bacteriophage sp.]